jgi:hypothetical protein
VAVVEEYWSGVLQRLQAEVDLFNSLIKHSGEKGRENELSLARILEKLVPRKYGIGSGMLIDSQDSYSSQTDIVVFNQADDPGVLAQTNQVLFPVENVKVCIEVKTTVGKDEIIDCAKKVRSVKALVSTSERSRPIYALVGYKASTYVDTLVSNLADLPLVDRPDIVCILNVGLVGGLGRIFSRQSPAGEQDYYLGHAALHDVDENGSRRPGVFVDPPEDFDEPILSSGPVQYPITKVGKGFTVVEPSRALLLYCEALLRELAWREGDEIPTLSHYLSATAHELISVYEKI